MAVADSTFFVSCLVSALFGALLTAGWWYVHRLWSKQGGRNYKIHPEALTSVTLPGIPGTDLVKRERLRKVKVFVLDNSLRESTVGQVRCHAQQRAISLTATRPYLSTIPTHWPEYAIFGL